MSYVRVTSHYITRVILQFTEVIHWPDANVVKFRLDTVHFLNNFPCDLRVSTCHITFVDLNASAQLSLFISPVIPIVQHSPLILCFIYSRVSSLIRTCKSKDKELTINRELFDVWCAYLSRQFYEVQSKCSLFIHPLWICAGKY